MTNTLSVERLRELLDYSPETGIFTWKIGGHGWRRVGVLAGSQSIKGYQTIGIDGREYAAHRLAWLYVHGEWPEGALDHINRDKADNRIANLRPATYSQNRANRLGKSASGFKGVYWHKKVGKFQAQIRIEDKRCSLGYFTTAEEAHEAYKTAAIHHFGEFACFEHQGEHKC